MATITTSPGFRFGWQGTSVDYAVQASGASELSLPKSNLPGLQAQLLDVHKTADGVEGRVHVEMRESSFV
jgi:hypothetical protein